MKKNLLYKIVTLCILIDYGKVCGQNIEVVANNVSGVNGLFFDQNQNLWFTQTGTGQDDGIIKCLHPNKIISTVVTNLPCYYDSTEMEVSGPWKVYLKGTDL